MACLDHYKMWLSVFLIFLPTKESNVGLSHTLCIHVANSVATSGEKGVPTPASRRSENASAARENAASPDQTEKTQTSDLFAFSLSAAVDAHTWK